MAIAVAAGLFFWRRRRRAAADVALWQEPSAADEAVATDFPPELAPLPPPPPVAPSAPPLPAAAAPAAGLVTTSLRPALQFELKPVVVEVSDTAIGLQFSLHVRNTGRGSAHDVAVEAWLAGLAGEPQAMLDDIAQLEQGPPMAEPFALPASGAIDLDGQAVTERASLAALGVGERQMLIPVLLARVAFRDARGAAQQALVAFVIGAERPGQDRLAPLALDRGERRYATLAARRYP